MSKRLIRLAHDRARQLNLTPSEKAVLVSLAYAVQDEAGDTCFASNGWVARQNNLTARGVQKIRKRLEERKLVALLTVGGGRKSNVYRLTLDTVPEAPAEPARTHERRSPVNGVHRTPERRSQNLLLFKNSDPYGSAPPAPPPAESLKSQLFGPCLDWLAMKTGLGKDGLRKFVGGQLKAYSEGEVLAAFMQAEKDDPLEPKAYIVGVLKNGSNRDRPAKRGRRSGEVASAEDVRRAFAPVAVERGYLPPDPAAGDGR